MKEPNKNFTAILVECDPFRVEAKRIMFEWYETENLFFCGLDSLNMPNACFMRRKGQLDNNYLSTWRAARTDRTHWDLWYFANLYNMLGNRLQNGNRMFRGVGTTSCRQPAALSGAHLAHSPLPARENVTDAERILGGGRKSKG